MNATDLCIYLCILVVKTSISIEKCEHLYEETFAKPHLMLSCAMFA